MLYPNYFNIMPVKDKKPLIEWKSFTENAQTVEQKKELLSKFPNSDIGIVTGKISKVLVMDDDGGLDLSKYPVPLTWTSKTRTGKTHYYFRWVSELNNKITNQEDIFKQLTDHQNVDVKGQGGYVVFYGFEKPYHTVPLALPPKWLIDILPNKDGSSEVCKVSESPDSWIIEALESIVPEHSSLGRTPTFIKVINALKSKGLLIDEVKAFLKPWGDRYDYRKLDKQIEDQYKRYPPQVYNDNPEKQSFIDFMQDQKKIDYVVPGFFAENTINIIAGLQESRKSWVLLDLAIAIASGTDWLSKFPTKQRRVMIIDQERPKLEMQRRFKALMSAKSLKQEDLNSFIFPKVGTTFRVNLDRSFEHLCRIIEEDRPEVLLVDSLKTFQTVNITDNQSMQLVFERIKEIRTKYNLTIVILHHENKGAYVRAREGAEITAENIAGAAVINEVPEGLFVVVNQDADSSLMYHVKNSYGTKLAPTLIKVSDMNAEKTAIKVEAY